MRKYSIGEFAEILGVTVDTLRLYEKHGIIKPIKDAKNNYRYFNDLDARDLLMSRWYRSIQIPLQDVSVLTKESSLDNVIEKMKEKQICLEEEIRKSRMLLDKIIHINSEVKAIPESLNKCKIKKLTGIYRLRQTSNNDLLKDECLKGIVSKWMNLLPYTFYSFRIDSSEILSQKNCFDYSWGIAISEDDINNFDLEIDDNIEFVKSKTYLSSIITVSNEERIMRDSLKFMLEHMREKNYSISGDIIGKIILTEKHNGENKHYLQVNIPI
jgi:DNA-binding transcriptional MerR regulator